MEKFYIKESIKEDKNYCSAQVIYEEFKKLSQADQESFWIIGLNCNNRLLIKECLFKGGIDIVPIDFIIIFKRLLKSNSARFVVIHNHPTGLTKPSSDDDKITKKISLIASIIGIEFLDHIIIGDNFYSYRNEKAYIFSEGSIKANEILKY